MPSVQGFRSGSKIIVIAVFVRWGWSSKAPFSRTGAVLIAECPQDHDHVAQLDTRIAMQGTRSDRESSSPAMLVSLSGDCGDSCDDCLKRLKSLPDFVKHSVPIAKPSLSE